jgi:hypothetical protein
MIEIIRSVKVYKPSKTFRHLFIHLSLGLANPQNHHFEISKLLFRLSRESSPATIERADRKLPTGISGTQRNLMPDGMPDPRTATSKFRSCYSGFLVGVAQLIVISQIGEVTDWNITGYAMPRLQVMFCNTTVIRMLAIPASHF